MAGKSQDVSSSATVEIQGVAKQFRTRSSAAADMLFLPLVSSAKRAMAIADEVARGTSNLGKSPALLARTYLVGMMLEDPTFVTTANSAREDNHYVIDLELGSFSSRMWINAAHENRSLLMQAETVGRMKEGLYEVRDLRDKSILLQFSEQDAHQPHFFAEVLPQRCIVEIMQRERSEGLANVDAGVERVKISVNLQISGSVVILTLQKDEAGPAWIVYDGRSNIKLGDLAIGDMDHGSGLVEDLIAFLKSGHRHFLDALPLNARRGILAAPKQQSETPARPR
jgi:hypothetical protein